MSTYASSRVKRKRFYRKSELQMFLLISAAIYIGAPKRYKGAWNVSANNSETVGHKDLRLAQIVNILVFYNKLFSWLLPLDGLQFVTFLLRDSENDLQKFFCHRQKLVPRFLAPAQKWRQPRQRCRYPPADY